MEILSSADASILNTSRDADKIGREQRDIRENSGDRSAERENGNTIHREAKRRLADCWPFQVR